MLGTPAPLCLPLLTKHLYLCTSPPHPSLLQTLGSLLTFTLKGTYLGLLGGLPPAGVMSWPRLQDFITNLYLQQQLGVTAG